MPTLEWVGKAQVVHHDAEVPVRTVEPVWGYDASRPGDRAATGSGNRVIHGDNLEALKALLPELEGRVGCIYIDPPYNTGEEGWVYNDNVSSPRLARWLGAVVGRAGKDLSRDDKWLCMMYPRLKLLRRLLVPDGAIFISIDDNELANLKLVCDEIFGARLFVAQIPWRKRTAKSDVPFGVSQDYEWILCYAGSDAFRAAVAKDTRRYYETLDFPGRPWRYHDMTTQRSKEERPNCFFTIVNPKSGEEYPANPNRVWANNAETFQDYLAANRIIFPGDYDFLSIVKPVIRYWKADDDAKGGLFAGSVALSTHLPKEVGMTQTGTQELVGLFGGKAFSFPKPSSLVQYLIGAATYARRDAIVLDSFAGSGTTAQAVLQQNAADGGHRRFVLIEMEDYAERLTAERARRVMAGHGAAEGLGGAFDFCRLGESLVEADGGLNVRADEAALRAYVYWRETGRALARPREAARRYFLDAWQGVGYYFYYEPKGRTELSAAALEGVLGRERAARCVVYADVCTARADVLAAAGVTFKKIPRGLERG